MATSHHCIITRSLSQVEKRMVDRATIKANAPSSDSALLGAVRLLEMLKDAGLTIPTDVMDRVANPMATIDDWNEATNGPRTVVVGTISGDPRGRFRDGDIVHSGMLTDHLGPIELHEGAVVSTRSAQYRLGRRADHVPNMHYAIIAETKYVIRKSAR